MLSAKQGTVEAGVLLAFSALYYLYFRGNNPFIKFEDVDGANLHYRAEETKVALTMFLLVVAIIGAQDREMSDICGYIFTIITGSVVILVTKNFIVGVRNTNLAPGQTAPADAEKESPAGADGKSEPPSSSSSPSRSGSQPQSPSASVAVSVASTPGRGSKLPTPASSAKPTPKRK